MDWQIDQTARDPKEVAIEEAQKILELEYEALTEEEVEEVKEKCKELLSNEVLPLYHPVLVKVCHNTVTMTTQLLP